MSALLCLLLLLLPPQTDERTQAFQVPGSVRGVLVQPGDSVQVGQVLARLDVRPAAREVARCQWQVLRCKLYLWLMTRQAAVAKAEMDRVEQLIRRGLWCGSVQEVEFLQQRGKAAAARVSYAQAEGDVARCALELAEQQRTLYTLQSDFTGTIVAVHKRTGEVVRGQETMFRIRLQSDKK